jgi:DNA polymerase elongation subunit (family B)
MSRKKGRGWVFDLYPAKNTIVLWFIEEGGGRIRLEDPYQPCFYAKGPQQEMAALEKELIGSGLSAPFPEAYRKDLWSGQEIRVKAIPVLDLERLPRHLQRIIRNYPEIELYNFDIPLEQLYLYEKSLFPLAHVCFEWEEGKLLSLASLDSPWDLDYTQPPLRQMEIEPLEAVPYLPPGRLPSLRVRVGEECWEWAGIGKEEEEEGGRLIEGLAGLIERHDPDLILSSGGDSHLFPSLFSLAQRLGIPFDLDREGVRRALIWEGRSYFSYGRILYQAPSYPLFGRWHIDRCNSFIWAETGLEGLVELSRLAKLPLQRMARRSPGTGITSMQMDRAIQEKILIPWHKGEPERFKTAWQLLVADKGGLVYHPVLGLHQEVGEIDFSSMYPAIMAQHNISPETVDCGCCQGERVPEVGYALCQRRRGLVPKTLEPILNKRRRYKELMKEEQGREREIYDQRQTALKWVLVTCFGYLGYKNARFGRIEAHEAVTAFGREKLLQAREIAETAGFRVLHAMVDSLWVQKEGIQEADLLRLCRDIGEATGIPLNLEGIYRWIAFLPSRLDASRSVANRYFGAFTSGQIKARGIELRRGDIPPFIQKAQWKMLHLMASAQNSRELEKRIPQVLALMKKEAERLQRGEVDREELVIRRTLSRKPEEYMQDNWTALASRKLEGQGVRLHPGEEIRFLLADVEAEEKGRRVKVPPWGEGERVDVSKYLEYLAKSVETLLWPWGFQTQDLLRLIEDTKEERSPRRRRGHRETARDGFSIWPEVRPDRNPLPFRGNRI